MAENEMSFGCRTEKLPAGEEIIHVDCASHRYPDGTLGIHDMCFHVMKNEIVSICGPNGAGKSTLVEHLNGTLLPHEGKIVVDGKEQTEAESRELWKVVGVVFQNPDDQLFAPTVLDDVMFGPLNLGMSRKEAEEVAMEALSAVGAEDLAHRLPSHLSWGQRRLISIAGVLAMKPRVMVLDEPTSGLDPLNGKRIEELICRVREEHGISVVIATHDLELAGRISDRVYLIKKGSVIASGSPREILYNVELLRRADLMEPILVHVYLDCCRANGVEPEDRPLTAKEIVEALAAMNRRAAGG